MNGALGFSGEKSTGKVILEPIAKNKVEFVTLLCMHVFLAVCQQGVHQLLLDHHSIVSFHYIANFFVVNYK